MASRLSTAFLGWSCFAALIGAGCKSASQYISPRVEGRVVDARTQAPIEDVLITRFSDERAYDRADPPRGGQLMQRSQGVRTGPDGTFVLASQRDVALLQRFGWYSLTLRFRHRAYEDLTVTYTLSQGTNTATGEPLVKAGDIQLTPRTK